MGTETLNGTAANDIIQTYLLGFDPLTDFRIFVGNGDDVVRSGAGNDFIAGGKGEDRIFSGAGDDLIQAGNHNDYVNAGTGNDFIMTGVGDDIIYAGKGNDQAFGGSGNDTIYGQKGNNTLDGGSGDDVINTGVHGSTALGGEGSDTLIADMRKGGFHTLNGGADDDTFVFTGMNTKRHSKVTVEDFELGLDDFTVGGVADTDFMTDYLSDPSGSGVTLVADGVDIVMTLATNDTIIFKDLDAAAFIDHYDDFLVV